MEQPRNLINTQVGLNRFLTKMYGWMAAAVAFSGIIAYLGATIWRTAVQTFLTQGRVGISIIFIGMFIFMWFGQRSALQNPMIGFLMLFGFAGFFGITLSGIFLVYNLGTIAAAFFSAAIVFIVMAVIGLTTKRDLSKMGTQLFGALIAMIVVSLINAFLLHSPAVTFVFSFIGVAIFSLLTMYDNAQMKQLYLNYGDQVSETGLALQGSLSMYLSFLNLFQYFLQIFGFFSGDRN
ncbi:Bax inhibitor-1/YccA family protein [Pediococcus argentinicus]|uniref:Integral membrane protein, interacts with FtsH n=1 Tax=Pediococcus argentinicus TaxID=480391 RepID=A0A0R2NIT7_9LACO|nr:Bax inhibitor-1/YccA family protein [Pediococcus argentinicus]KRO25685.1 integral membrane protein, interacts with FtsH [Pediococcus argentinicus]NKZ21978.1 Bax inhibitor-1/YccA family protein [Pediococcus argentinicus]GEP19147.1 membrane protein [Pediococcus argentinicus]